MPVIFTKDSLRASVEAATGGNITVLYDDKGYPSYMRVIPRFNLENIDSSLGTGPFPAFVVNGVVKSEIFIGQYEASVLDERACSIPGVTPTVCVSYDQAKQYCMSKGQGWHLMTNWEWAAIAWWCMKNGFQPRGNTNTGASYNAPYEKGRVSNAITVDPIEQFRVVLTLTGSGPASWRHDGTFSGISDLIGNTFEWIDGIRTVEGLIYFAGDNNYVIDESQYINSGVYINGTNMADPSIVNQFVSTGTPTFADSITNRAGVVGDNEFINRSYLFIQYWKNTTVTTTSVYKAMLQQALVIPTLTSSGQLLNNIAGGLFSRNYGTRYAVRGGGYDATDRSGLAYLNFNSPRNRAQGHIGFRPAYIL